MSPKPPPAPDFATGLVAVTRLSSKRLLRSRKLRLAIASLVLVVGATLVARYAMDVDEPAALMRDAARLGFFGLLGYLLPFLFSSGSIAEEVETRTLPYLLMRPTSRFALALGKYLTGVLFSFGLLTVGILVLHVGVYATTPSAMIDELGSTGRLVGGLALLALAESAICLFWSALISEASGLMSTLHLGAIEFALGMMPFSIRFVSMNYWATQVAGLPKGGFLADTVPDVESWIAIVVVAVVTTAFVLGGMLVVRMSQFGFGKA